MTSSTINLDFINNGDQDQPSPGSSKESSKSSAKQEAFGPRSAVFNLIQGIVSAPPDSSGVLSAEAEQQLLWLAGKQKSKEQRDSITASSNWGMGYLARYFDVTTHDVVERILWSAIPIRKAGIELSEPLIAGSQANEQDEEFFEELGSRRRYYSYVERFIQSRPDFYGPLWISTTLIFAIAIFSNMARFSGFRSETYQMKDLSDKLKNITVDGTIVDRMQQANEWHYSVDELNMATTLILSYVILIPIFLWFFFWFRGCTKYYTLTETVCAYAYSLSIFIPIAALLMIQNLLVRYTVISIGALLTSLVLIMSFHPIVKSDPSSGGSHIILVIIPISQVCLAYFLHKIMLQ